MGEEGIVVVFRISNCMNSSLGSHIHVYPSLRLHTLLGLGGFRDRRGRQGSLRSLVELDGFLMQGPELIGLDSETFETFIFQVTTVILKHTGIVYTS